MLLIDSHVHIYDCYDYLNVFNVASKNASENAKRFGLVKYDTALLLTENQNQNFFSKIKNADNQADEMKVGDWNIVQTSEAMSIVLINSISGERVFVLAGRQVVTKEGIEVSALLTDDIFPDGEPISETLTAIQSKNGIPALPWGAGKWLGKRGRLVSSLIKTRGNIFLSDNGSRPKLWPYPCQFKQAEMKNIKVLAGSDPLPIPGDETRIGSFGFILNGDIDDKEPGRWLFSSLTKLISSPEFYGELSDSRQFLSSQYNLRKYRRYSSYDHVKKNDNSDKPDIETSTEEYSKRFKGRAGAYLLSVQEQALAKVLTMPKGSHILDVGGGHGQITEQLLSMGFKVTVFGSDICCKERLAKFMGEKNFSFVTGSLYKLPFDDQSFDCVVSIRLVSHIKSRSKLFSELCRVAKNTIIIDYPSWYSLNILTPALFKMKKFIESNTRTYVSFSGRTLQLEFAAHGFHTTSKTAQFFLPMFFHRWFESPPLLQMLESWLKLIRVTAILGSPVVLRVDRQT